MKRSNILSIAPRGVAAALLVVVALVGCGGPQTGANGESDALQKARALCSNLDGPDRAECIERKRREEEAQQRMEKIRAECGAERHYDTTTPEGEREDLRAAACMVQMQMQAQGAREQQAEEQERQDDQRRLDAARQQRKAERDQRRKLRETAPCTEDNARQELVDDAADQHETEIDGGHGTSIVLNARRSDDQVQQRRQQCIDSRIAPCQTKIESNDDLAGAAVCWSQVHDNVDPPDVNKPADVQACLDGVAEDLRAVQACVALPEKSDDEIIAKADCVAQRVRNARDPRANTARSRTPLAAMRPDNTCGHFSLVKYVDRQLGAAKIDEEAARIDAKAKDPRARVAARESVCKALNVIEFEQRQLDQERAIERESGVEDLGRRREIGSTLVLFKQQYQAALTDYQRVWKRSFSRPRDCVKRPSLRGVVKLGASVKDKVRDGAAIEVSLHVPGMGDAGSKRLLWRGDAVAFEFEKVAVMGLKSLKIVGGDVEIRARCLGDSCGDISGAVTVRVPADHVEVVLNVVPKSEAEPADQLPQSSP